MPEYSWAQEHLTLEDAMSHRTGFPRHDKSLGTRYGDHQATVADLTRSLRHLPMVTEPRTDFRYCNLLWMVVSHAAEVLAGGAWLGDLMRDLIWRPLGMNSTYFSRDDALAGPEHLARGYYWDYQGSTGGYTEVPFQGLREGSGAGAVISSVLDYTRWLHCLLDEAAPLSKSGHAAVKTPRITPAGGSFGWDAAPSYALGWWTTTYQGHQVYYHSGGMLAHGANVWFFPQLRYGIVAMGNTALTSNLVDTLLGFRLMDDRLGIPEGERYDRRA